MRSGALGAVLALALVAGCTQLLGLDDTTFDQKDAPTDAPYVCDRAPGCTSFIGRSACGQIFGLGNNARIPLRVSTPTGQFCDGSSVAGPCGLTIEAMAKSELFGAAAVTIGGSIDDCGRYVVPDIDATIADIAVVLSGPGYRRSATLVLGRSTVIGVDMNIDVYAMTDEVAVAWAAQLSTPVARLQSGYLVKFEEAGGGLAPTSLAKDGSPALTTATDTPPWAAYFGGEVPFGIIDPTRTTTGPTMTALGVFDVGAFALQGVRSGQRCSVAGLQQVVGTMIYVKPTGC